jgi:O-antigen ligase
MNMKASTAVGLLILLSWLLPLNVLPWNAWQKEALTFAAAILLFADSVRAQVSTRKVVFPAPAIWFLLLIGILMWQVIGGTVTFRGDAVVLSFYFLVSVMTLGVGFAQPDVRKAAVFISILFLTGALASTFIAYAQALNVWTEVTWISRLSSLRRPGANLGQPNHLATLLLIAMAGLLYLRATATISRGIEALLGLVLLAGLAVTESRTGILGLLMLVTWWFVRLRPSASERTGLIVGVILFLGLVWNWPQFHQFIMVEDGEGHLNTTAGTRLVVWPQLLQAAMMKPWTGWGLRNVSEALNAVLDTYPVGNPFTYAHNIVLDLVVGAGLPLAVILTGAAVVWFVRRARQGRGPETAYFLGVLMIFGLHSQLEFPFAYAYLLFPVLFIAGLLERRVVPARTYAVPMPVVVVACFATCLVMAWSAWEYLQIEEDFQVARFESMRIGDTPQDHVRPTVHLLTQLDTLLVAVRMQPKEGMSENELELARQAAMRFPWGGIQNRYALALACNGKTEEALRQLKVMRAMHGEGYYQAVKAAWTDVAQTNCSSLRDLKLP